MYGIPGIVDMEVHPGAGHPGVQTDRGPGAGRQCRGDDRRYRPHRRRAGRRQGRFHFEDEEGDAVDVRLRMAESQRQDLSQVENIRLAVFQSNGRNILVPLNSLVSYEVSTTPSEIDRQDLTRQVVLSANLDRLALGTAVEKIKEAAAKIEMAAGLPGHLLRRGGGNAGILRLHGRGPPAGHHLCLPGSGGPVRVFHRPPGHHGVAAPGHRRYGRDAPF